MSVVRSGIVTVFLLFILAAVLAVIAVIIAVVVLSARAKKTTAAQPPAAEPIPSVLPAEDPVQKSLAEKLKEARLSRGMTQEFVAESLGVSRQAVSKWETGAADPSTGNLLALAKLYGVSAADLLP